MQTYAFADEYPILLHTDKSGSTTLADGIDTAAVDVDKGQGGKWEVVLTKEDAFERARSNLATIVERRQHLWSIYAYTPITALTVYGGAKGEVKNRWVINREFVSKPILDEPRRAVVFEKRQGRLYYLTGKPLLREPSQWAMRPCSKSSVRRRLVPLHFPTVRFNWNAVMQPAGN